jgi:hypothetical protein
MATETTEEKQQFDALVAKLNQSEREALLSWKPPRGLKETYRAGIAILSWLMSHKFAVTTHNLDLAVGQTRLQPYLEYEHVSNFENSEHSRVDDGKPFLTDGLRRLANGSLGKTRADYAREAREATNSEAVPEERLSESDKSWQRLCNDLLAYGSHARQAETRALYQRCVDQGLSPRKTWETLNNLVNQFKKAAQISYRQI